MAVHPLSRNPVARWIVGHCQKQTLGSDTTFTDEGTTFKRFLCPPPPVSTPRPIPTGH
jgi:hypothetical protein